MIEKKSLYFSQPFLAFMVYSIWPGLAEDIRIS